ncbi:MAG: hypothetical protein ACRDCN_06545 [Tannerellaceae bacterium]
MIHSNFYKILGWIHVSVVFSLIFSLFTLASAGFLFLPLLAVGFELVKVISERGFDPHLRVIPYMLQHLKRNLRLFRFNGVYIVFVLNVIGTMLGILTQQALIMYLCSVFSVLTCIFIIYLAFYTTWIQERCTLLDVFIFMFYKIRYVVTLFIFLLSCVYFSQGIIVGILIFLNFFVILLIALLLNEMRKSYCELV